MDILLMSSNIWCVVTSGLTLEKVTLGTLPLNSKAYAAASIEVKDKLEQVLKLMKAEGKTKDDEAFKIIVDLLY